jgi:hypothetical protein
MSNLLDKVTVLPSGVVTIIGKKGKVYVFTQDEFYNTGAFLQWWGYVRCKLGLV